MKFYLLLSLVLQACVWGGPIPTGEDNGFFPNTDGRVPLCVTRADDGLVGPVFAAGEFWEERIGLPVLDCAVQDPVSVFVNWDDGTIPDGAIGYTVLGTGKHGHVYTCTIWLKEDQGVETLKHELGHCLTLDDDVGTYGIMDGVQVVGAEPTAADIERLIELSLDR